MWINPCAQVIFDSDPAPKDMTAPAGVEMMSQAMIRCLQIILCVDVCFDRAIISEIIMHISCFLNTEV